MELGEKIKNLRLHQRLTIQQLSQKAGVSTGVLSQIERGVSAPTVTTLQKISSSLDTTMSELFSDDGDVTRSRSSKNGVHSSLFRLVRGHRRKKITMPWGAYFEMLSPDLQHKIEFIYFHYPVGAKVGEIYAHEGEECGVVLKGRFKGIIGNEEVILEPGDAVYYDSSVPHSWENAGDTDVEAIWVITPPWL